MRSTKIKKQLNYIILAMVMIVIVINIIIVLLECEMTILEDDYEILSLNYEESQKQISDLESKNYMLEKQIEKLNTDNKQGTIPIIKVEIIENQELNRWNIELTQDEITLLAQIVWLEAGNQSQEGQMAVVEVIFNRMIDSYYGGTLEEVLSAPSQFSTWKNKDNAKPTAEVYQSIYNVLYGQSDIFSYDVLYFATSSNGKSVVKVIEDHVFCM